MCSLIGCGHWNRYYFYILISFVAKFFKEDLLGLGVKYPIIKNLKIIYHPIITLLIGYISDFLLSLILWLVYNYREKKLEERKSAIINESEEENLSKNYTLDKVFELKDTANRNQTFNSEKGDNDDLIKKTTIKSESKYSLIHNDINLEYEDLSKSSRKFVIISSGLIVIKEIGIKIVYSSNDVFDFYFLNLVIIAIILKCFYKKKIYKHHILAIILVVIISGACLISSIIIIKNNKFVGDKKDFYLTYDGKIHYIIILILVYIIMSIGFCIGIVYQKNLMQIKFISSYKFLFCKGIIGTFFCIIGLVFSTTFNCVNSNPPYIPNINSTEPIIPDHGDKPPDFIHNGTNQTEQKFQFFMCLDHYNNKSYFDNFYSYFKNEEDNKTNNVVVEVFVVLGFFILNFVSNLSLILVNKFLTPIHYLITESFYSLLHIPYQYFTREDTLHLIETLKDQAKRERTFDKLYIMYFHKDGPMLLKFFAAFFEFIGNLIYMEIIQLNFCGFNRDLSKNIKKRAKLDSILSERELNREESDENDDSLEMSRKYK